MSPLEAIVVRHWRSTVFDEVLLRLDDGYEVQVQVVLKEQIQPGRRVCVRPKVVEIPGVIAMAFYELI